MIFLYVFSEYYSIIKWNLTSLVNVYTLLHTTMRPARIVKNPLHITFVACLLISIIT